MQRRMALLFLVLFATAVTARNAGSAGLEHTRVRRVAITFNENDPRIAFAVGDIKRALVDAGYSVDSTGADLQIVFEIRGTGMGPQGFRIRKEERDPARLGSAKPRQARREPKPKGQSF